MPRNAWNVFFHKMPQEWQDEILERAERKRREKTEHMSFVEENPPQPLKPTDEYWIAGTEWGENKFLCWHCRKHYGTYGFLIANTIRVKELQVPCEVNTSWKSYFKEATFEDFKQMYDAHQWPQCDKCVKIMPVNLHSRRQKKLNVSSKMYYNFSNES